MNTKTAIYRRIIERFRIRSESDFRAIRAAEILSVEGVGKAWLNKLRLHLAHQGIALKDDNPPAYWLKVLAGSDDAPAAEYAAGVCPFTIVVDVNETLPFRFDSLQDREGRTIDVPTVRQPLYTQGLGDYSISGMEHLIQIERKGDDLPSSLAQRREEFESEIRRLSEGCEFAAVVIEQPWAAFFSDDHQHGARAKSIFRTVLQWQVAYPGVHWWFCDSRPMAEAVTFRLLERFWWAKQRELNELEKSSEIWSDCR
jgi:hypothetical protein